MVIWPRMASCADSFYSIMYHPNWNSVLSSYTRKSFQKEERVPASRSSFVVENLTPLTTYLLCVTCQSASPSSDQCQVFNTLEQDPASASTTKKELALGIWLASSLLLCRVRREQSQGQARASQREAHDLEEPSRQSRVLQNSKEKQPDGIQLATIIENPAVCKEPGQLVSSSRERAPAAGQCPAVSWEP